MRLQAFETHLVEYCAPTLAGLKTGSMFNYAFGSEGELMQILEAYGKDRGPAAPRAVILRKNQRTALFYVYRPNKLAADLSTEEARRLLRHCGYPIGTEPEEWLACLIGRIADSQGFPHEIGLFLGYPLHDVLGFIENKGQNCRLSGCWKVYCREQEAEKTFARFKRCSEVYRRLFDSGRSLAQLTVAV